MKLQTYLYQLSQKLAVTPPFGLGRKDFQQKPLKEKKNIKL
jgi:hypothetical protein